MISRIVAFVLMLWLLGFIAFGVFLPKPVGKWSSDGVVVFTGGEGRVGRGLEVLREGWAKQLLVSGVDPEVRPAEFRAEYGVSRRLMNCCVTLGYDSYDTRSNAVETSLWIGKHKIKTLRLVTSDWHMRRAEIELDRVKPSGVTIVEDAVHRNPSLRILVLEYNKFVLRAFSRLTGN